MFSVVHRFVESCPGWQSGSPWGNSGSIPPLTTKWFILSIVSKNGGSPAILWGAYCQIDIGRFFESWGLFQ